ncbi:SARP family transcriptional regulator [Longispora fulva]|uniref:DNA-binding SARP family transcriptional activator n=1 Tax=Longispora fulva TaxID=619741 RepID=A0A8J7GCH9_9ACTN|nr:AfsR/SARP family transcriptional regulator [Longispora fulva]MBG6135101.1 DNA-binding SARP family transcriptional activator [Longispora fulva]GIG56664.1 SARP family transcriptional regulator [Longispora fulva]
MEFRVLGPVEVWKDGAEIPLDGSKQRTVLAALLLADGRIVSDERLSSLLWGENPPATLNAQICTYVSRLRKSADPGMEILRQRPGYLIRLDGARYDHGDFERLAQTGRAALRDGRHADAAEQLRAALALWRGPALANVTEFLLGAEQLRLEEARIAVLESRIDADLALGRHAPLVPELTGLVAEHPLREGLRAQLMTALYRCDRQADALAVYHDGRKVLVDELGVDPGPTLSKAHHDILVACPTLDAPATRIEIAAPRPAMLPADLGDFTGRTAELARVAAVLGDDGATAVPCLVTGMPGVGKSVLAVRAAHQARADFPDGQLYVDLAGDVEPAEALAWFLRALGVEDDALPAGLDERIQMYRTLVATRRVLVVLDNARDDAQVAPLLPGGPTCRVIVTSRAHLPALAAAHPVALEPFGTDDALVLFAAVIGVARYDAERDAAERIVARCAGLPLALRVAGTRLVARPHWPVSRLLDRLETSGQLLDEFRLGALDLRESLHRAYRTLPALARTGLRRLALLDVPDFPAWALAAVLEVPEEPAEDLAEALLDARLLELRIDCGGRQRYAFHDLVRPFARERAEDEEPPRASRAALDRAFGAWLSLATECSRRLDGVSTRPARGDAPRWRLAGGLVNDLAETPVAWFEAEHGALVALVAQAAASGQAAAAWELAGACEDYFELRGHQHDWRRTYQRAHTAARTSGDARGEAAMQLGLARLAGYRGDANASLTYADRAAALHAALGDPVGESEALRRCADAYRHLGHPASAEDGARRALEIAVAGGDRAGTAGARTALGDVLQDLGRHAEARVEYQAAVELSRTLSDPRRTAGALSDPHHTAGAMSEPRRAAGALDGLARLDLEAGRYADAESGLARCLAVYTLAGDQAGRATTLTHLGHLRLAEGRHDAARSLYRDALALLNGLGLQRRYAHACAVTGLGRIAAAQGESGRAVHLLTTAAELWTGLGLATRATGVLTELDGVLGRPRVTA